MPDVNGTSGPPHAQSSCDVQPFAPGPFTDFGQFGYGRIDKRVLDQDTYWVDIAGRPHLLTDMSREYLDNVRTFVLSCAEEWWLVELVADAVEAAALATFNPNDPEAERALTRARQLSDAGPRAWIASTPLIRRLTRLLETLER